MGTPTTPRGRSALTWTERLIYSPLHYWFVFYCDLAAVFVFLALGIHRFADGPITGAALVATGFLVWGLVEYLLHRWVLHGPPSMARRSHARHHANGAALISAPAFVILAGACVIWALLALVVPVGAADLLIFGLYGGYNYYALLHHVQHAHQPFVARVGYLARLERVHHIHHKRHIVNYGVSTTLWDRLLGTYQPPDMTSGSTLRRSSQ